MVLPQPLLSPQGSGRSLVSAPNSYGYVIFKHKPTLPQLQEYLRLDKAHFDAIVADVNHAFYKPANSHLLAPGFTFRGKSGTATARQISKEIQTSHSKGCNFDSHPDPNIVQACIYDVVKKQLAALKRGQEFTTALITDDDGASTAQNISHRGQKRASTLSLFEDDTPPPAKTARIERPTGTTFPYASLYRAPTKAIRNHSSPTPFDGCTTRVTGSRNAAEFYAPLIKYLIQKNPPHSPLRGSDFDYEKWFIDMKAAMNFDPSCEVLQYKPLIARPVYVRNPIEWRCAISEMASSGQTRLDFEITKLVPIFPHIDQIMPQYQTRRNLVAEAVRSTHGHLGESSMTDI